jgi:hypothetical protein
MATEKAEKKENFMNESERRSMPIFPHEYRHGAS